MINFKAAIFDFDGTVLDSMPMWENLGLEFLKKHNIIPHENLREELKPLGFNQTGSYFKERFSLALSEQEIMDDIKAMIKDQYLYHAPLKPNAKDYLDKLKKENIKMCIATATNKKLAQAALKRLDAEEYFEFILTCDDVGYNKDHPDIYIKAADKLGYSAGEIAVFEDALHGIITAKRAGFIVYGVYDKSAEQIQDKIKRLCDNYIYNFDLKGNLL